tara:strand:+ start:3946 stop:4404 length:459 start_codon:yes stop_codon:yes gene_type:complete
MDCIKHLVECHCKLPQYRSNVNAPYHQFVVFSAIDNSETVIPKHAACNNCGVVHNIFDIAKSEILLGQETGAVMEKDDVGIMLPDSLKNILTSYNCGVPDWEHVLFVLQNEKFPESIIIDRNIENDIVSGKLLLISGHGKYNIQPFSRKIAI